MKKLLALVLCVMMFVSVLSTNAFADKALVPAHPDMDTGTIVNTPRAASNNDAIKKAKENIEYMYGALAADNAVFGTIKSMDSVIGSLAKELFKDVDEFMGIPGGKLESNTKTVLRDYVGSAIVNYLDDHRSTFETASQSYKVTLKDNTTGSLTYTGKTTETGDPIYIDKDGAIYGLHGNAWYKAKGNINVWQAQHDETLDIEWDPVDVTLKREYKYDPIKYANTFAAAVSNAFSSKDGASMIEAMAYQLYSAKVLDEMGDKFDDLYDEIVDWEDGSAILSQYHFHDTLANGWFDNHSLLGTDVFTPYAMMDVNDYPNTMALPDGIFVP
jgi:hypothetical protein